MSITLNETQKIQVQTHIDLIQKGYTKVQAQQFATAELEKDFQGFVNGIISENGGDPEKQYTYNIETGTLEESGETPPPPPMNLDGAGVQLPDDPKLGDSFEV